VLHRHPELTAAVADVRDLRDRHGIGEHVDE
jgi:hypothetical protein